MSHTWQVKVTAVDRRTRTLTLHLTPLQPSGGIPDSTAAGLFLLAESAQRLKRATVPPMCAVGDAWMDHDWLFEHAPEYVTTFDPLDDPVEPEGSVLFRLRATDARWISHLRLGTAWGSTCPEI